MQKLPVTMQVLPVTMKVLPVTIPLVLSQSGVTGNFSVLPVNTFNITGNAQVLPVSRVAVMGALIYGLNVNGNECGYAI